MIDGLASAFAVPRAARVRTGRLSKSRVEEFFQSVRSDLEATTLHKEVKLTDSSSGVVWSLWVGRFEKAVTWLPIEKHKELRYAFALVLEHNDFVAVLGSNIGESDESLADSPIEYSTLLAIRSSPSAEIESISTRSIRTGRTGIFRTTQTGRNLQHALSRVGAHQSAPSRVSLRQDEESWAVTPSTGRVSLNGGRAGLVDLCEWFVKVCEHIRNAKEPHEFIRAFAHPVKLDQLPVSVTPTSVQLDASVIEELLEQDAVFRRAGVPLTQSEVDDLSALARELWLVPAVGALQDPSGKTWRLNAGDTEVASVSIKTSKISLSCPSLRAIEVATADGVTTNLARIYNEGAQPFRVAFSDPKYGYAAGQLFLDHRLLGSRGHLLSTMRDVLPATASQEKAHTAAGFDPSSLFGHVVTSTEVRDNFLVCDDFGAEWADFIGISTATNEVSFYHCKGGDADVGASGLHEVVSQATKNLGYLTATRQEVQSRESKWKKKWKSTSVPRLQRGASTAAFVDAFTEAVASPQSRRRVVLVTSSLSRKALRDAFEDLTTAKARPEASHVLWLLSGFVDQCRAVGAIPEIVCRP